eukprot:scaffold82378_cov18-Tisochrysis_lutea.AAC.1
MSIAQATKLRVDWKTGVAATDWSAVAKKEHLDQLSVELRKLEDSIREVYTDMLMLQQREQEMRDISGGCGNGSHDEGGVQGLVWARWSLMLLAASASTHARRLNEYGKSVYTNPKRQSGLTSESFHDPAQIEW